MFNTAPRAVHARLYSFCAGCSIALAGQWLGSSRPTAAWLALLVAGIFATNWHVLESSLLIMSEPAFMLATFLVVSLGPLAQLAQQRPAGMRAGTVGRGRLGHSRCGIGVRRCHRAVSAVDWRAKLFKPSAFLRHAAPLAFIIFLPRSIKPLTLPRRKNPSSPAKNPPTATRTTPPRPHRNRPHRSKGQPLPNGLPDQSRRHRPKSLSNTNRRPGTTTHRMSAPARRRSGRPRPGSPRRARRRPPPARPAPAPPPAPRRRIARREEMARISAEKFECPPPLLPETAGFKEEGIEPVAAGIRAARAPGPGARADRPGQPRRRERIERARGKPPRLARPSARNWARRSTACAARSAA